MDDIEFDFEMTASPEETYAKLVKNIVALKSRRRINRRELFVVTG